LLSRLYLVEYGLGLLKQLVLTKDILVGKYSHTNYCLSWLLTALVEVLSLESIGRHIGISPYIRATKIGFIWYIYLSSINFKLQASFFVYIRRPKSSLKCLLLYKLFATSISIRIFSSLLSQISVILI